MFITVFHKIAKYEKQPKSHHSRGDKWNAIYSYSGILYNDFLKEYIIASYNMSESYSYYIKKKAIQHLLYDSIYTKYKTDNTNTNGRSHNSGRRVLTGKGHERTF